MRIYPISFARYRNKLQLIKRVWHERSNIQLILNSGNYQFLKFARPGSYSSPIPDIREIHARSHIVYDRSSTEIAGIDVQVQAQAELAREFVTYYKDIPFPEKKQDWFRYYLDNDYFSYGDGVVLYSMMRRFKPKRIIEVGSGFSSAAMLDVTCNGDIDFTFIEPFPDRLLSLLRDQNRDRCNILRAPVQEVSAGLFATLHENHILFVDLSHVAKTHSDVVHLLFNILPSLNRGVIVHFHDILWPFEYPSAVARLSGVHGMKPIFSELFYNIMSAFRILYFNSLMEIHHGRLFAQRNAFGNEDAVRTVNAREHQLVDSQRFNEGPMVFQSPRWAQYLVQLCLKWTIDTTIFVIASEKACVMVRLMSPKSKSTIECGRATPNH